MAEEPPASRATALSLVVALALPTALAASQTGTGAAPLRGVGIEARLDEAPVATDRIETLGGTLPVYVRLAVARELVEPEEGTFRFERLDARIERLERAETSRVLLVLDSASSTIERADAFARYVEAVSARYAGRVAGYVIASGGAPVYLWKLSSIRIRASDPEALVLLSGTPTSDPERLDSLYDEDLAPYVDGWVLDRQTTLDRADFDEVLAAAATIVGARDPSARLVVAGVPLDGADDAGETALTEVLANTRLGAPLTLLSGSPESLEEALAVASRLEDFLTHDVVALDESERGLRIEASAEPISRALYYDATASATYLFYWSEAATEGDTAALSLIAYSPAAPVLRDPLRGGRAAVEDFNYDVAAMRSGARVALYSRPLLLTLAEPAAATSVLARVDLSLDEIVARYRAAERRQATRLESYIASAVDEIHFRPSPTDPGFDVVVESRLYHDRDGVELEELSFSVNGARWGSDRPAFPLLQPEKVLALPLELSPDESYRYSLLGSEERNGRACYVIGIEPAPGGEARTLYRGRIWIDKVTFKKLRLELVQTNLASLVVSNEEVHRYEPVRTAEGTLYLLAESDRKQIVLLAGRNVLVERETRYSDFEVNRPDFSELREAARRSDRIMMRDTDEGMRYLVERGGERVLSDELTRSAKAFAMGTYVDPSFDYPLPILGLNYIDFDFLDKDAQLALLFGGVLAFGNLQKPRLFGTRLDASLDFFGIAVRADDKVFDAEGEDRARELRRLPGTIGLNLGWQFTPFQKLGGGYELRYDFFSLGESASEDFVEPRDTVTNSASLRYEYKRWGYALSAAGTFSERVRWEPWGDAEGFDPATRSYWKYSATLAKDFFFEPFQKVHFDVGYFGGERLDRFSRYQFGLFDPTRIHGVPSTAVRFEELYLARLSYSFNLFDLYRFDLFLDHGVGDDPSGISERVRLTGVGTALNVKGPYDTIVRLDLGKSFLPDRFRSAGTFTAQILILKPM